MLAVITFMAISFLVLSRAEHGSVSTETDQTQARLAADYALQRAIAQELAPIMAQTNEFSYDLLVSTNYINPFGFTNNVADPRNVNYDFDSQTHGALNLAEQRQNLANLWYDPRPPVFVTNRLSSGYEFRFFDNLNRNTGPLGPLFDPTGWLEVTNNGLPTGASNYFVGDPQWIGILESPDRPHAADNRFVSRYAYLAVPAGKTLDINTIHNYAKQLNPTLSTGDGFLRNQGVGCWEDNLGSFLVDLNTNVWPLDPTPQLPGYPVGVGYQYFTALAIPNTGAAFNDAVAMVHYRYLPGYNSLATVSQLYGPNGVNAFDSDGIDGYGMGPIMGVVWPVAPQDPDLTRPTGTPWSGAYNTNHFFTTQEFFDPTKSSPDFVTRLNAVGTNTNSSYDEFTFYRMLAQLGTDTAGDASRLNINYCNVDNLGNVVPNMATNFLAWQPLQFFTNAANALLRAYGYNFTVTNIEIYPTNYYTPNVNRLFQLAANIYDAANTRTNTTYPFLPSVFRPFFRRDAFDRVFIAGYGQVDSDADAWLGTATAPFPVVLGFNNAAIPLYTQAISPIESQEPLVTGIPFIIGAKKGLPNFNEFAMQTQAMLTRKLQFQRSGTGANNIDKTNQMYVFSLTNTFGIEAWNSYTSTYPRNLQVHMDAVMVAIITNELGTQILSNAVTYSPSIASQTGWEGFGGNTPYSFRAAISNFLFLTNCMYSDSLHVFETPPGTFEQSPGFPVPHWYLSLRPMIRYALVDISPLGRRIVDYVSLDAPQPATDLLGLACSDGGCGPHYQQDNASSGAVWCTNRSDLAVTTPTYGILHQIDVALGTAVSTNWPSASHQNDIDFFRTQFGMGALYNPSGQYSISNTFDCPFAPTRQISLYTSWQANDPLVHYTVYDLIDRFRLSPGSAIGTMTFELDTINSSPMNDLGGFAFGTSGVGSGFGLPVGAPTPLNLHYRPWGGFPNNSGDTPLPTNWRLEVKDPLLTRSDGWDFPTNKYPNVGWLGRVHRGTPWQTVYMKSPTIDTNTWMQWTGDTLLITNLGQISTSIMPLYDPTKPLVNVTGQLLPVGVDCDYKFSYPANDRVIFDLFTTAFNDNAARGRMSVNQKNLAAWSAVLGGVVTLRNTSPDDPRLLKFTGPQYSSVVIPPAGAYNPLNTNAWPALVHILYGINMTRATNFYGGVFHHVGDVLATPELSVASPFLNQGVATDPNTGGRYKLQYTSGIGEEAYERIPQQIMGLLQCDNTPRFVIYAYGQALKPAEHSIVTSGSYPIFGLCTNYQITAEVATRAVVRVDGAPTHPHAVIESFNVLPPD